MVRIIKTELNYLLYEDRPDKSFKILANLIEDGHPSLCISTVYPDKLRKIYDLEEALIVWLTDSESEGDTIRPERLDFEMSRGIMRFMEENDSPVIFIDGLEYLLLENDFKSVKKFFKRINDNASMNSATIIASLNPDSLERETKAALSRDFDMVGKPKEFLDEEKVGEQPKVEDRVEEKKVEEEPKVEEKKDIPETKSEPISETDLSDEEVTIPDDQKPPVSEPKKEKPTSPTAEQTVKTDTSSFQQVEELLTKASRYMKQHDHQKAIACYDKILDKNPRNTKALFNKAISHQMANQLSEAIGAYDSLLDVNPRDIDSLINKGLALRKIGRVDEAIKTYRKAAEIDPYDSTVWNNLGIALRNTGRIKESIECYDKGLEANPRDAGLWSNRGVALKEAGRLEESLESYDKALSIDPSRRSARRNKMIIEEQLGKR